jgi:hypothetical protein
MSTLVSISCRWYRSHICTQQQVAEQEAAGSKQHFTSAHQDTKPPRYNKPRPLPHATQVVELQPETMTSAMHMANIQSQMLQE